MAQIEAYHLSKTYNSGKIDEMKALNSVRLTVERESVVALTGPSGSGKSTLLGLIGCMSRPTTGEILINGRNISRLQEHFLTTIRRQTFGFIFQQYQLIRDITVLENILLPLYPLQLSYNKMKKMAEPILAQLEIDTKKDLQVKKLSGGEQQRVAIARALINDPEIIIADEPTAHLDQRLAEELLLILGRLNSLGKTIIIATHDPLVFKHRFITRRVGLRDGQVQLEEERS